METALESSGSGMLDSFLSIAVILLIMSLITEKLTNWWRRYTPLSGLANKTGMLVHISKSYSDADKQTRKKIEREVMVLSVIMGTLLSFAVKADLIAMIISSNPRSTLFWGSNNYPGKSETIQWAGTILGMMMSGVFLSFCAKLFHDLIETLQETKGLKKQQHKEKTFAIQSMGEFDQYVTQTQKETAKQAIQEQAPQLMARSNVLGVHRGMVEKNGKKEYCAVVHLANGDKDLIPKSLVVATTAGKSVEIPVIVEENMEIPRALGGVGYPIAESSTPTYTGTLGCVLRDPWDGAHYALTCSHVALSGDSRNLQGRAPSPVRTIVQLEAEGEMPVIGPVFSAIRNQYLDVALAGPVDLGTDNRFPGGLLNGFREITPEDVLQKTEVNIRGAKTITTGQFAFISSTAVDIAYETGESPQSFYGLFAVGKLVNGQWQSISQPGDSGAAVYDNDGKIVGIVVAGNSRYTYVMPMAGIVRHFDMNLV